MSSQLVTKSFVKFLNPEKSKLKSGGLQLEKPNRQTRRRNEKKFISDLRVFLLDPKTILKKV
jgi:hypothetical protein